MTEKPEIPGYTILGPLGEGGMAEVHLAIQENFQRKVAVKVLSARLLSDPSFGVRFLREARIVAQLSHHNIVPVYDVGQHGDCHYISMELLTGGDLKQRLAKGMPLAESIHITKQIASALHYASGKNIVHRDIKPENILFREDGSAVVSDFGIARSTEAEKSMTLTGTIIGTPSYMSPEQAQALKLDGRSDLYSLGVILFEMLTGHIPYTAESAVSISIKHITDPIPELPSNVTDFQELINKALAKSPDDRFQTGQDFIEALEDLEYELQENHDSTTIITPGATKRHKSGARRRTSGASAVVTRERTRANTNSLEKTQTHTDSGTRIINKSSAATQIHSLLFERKNIIAAFTISVFAIAGVAWWLTGESELSPNEDSTPIVNTRKVTPTDDFTPALEPEPIPDTATSSEKIAALLSRGESALKNGRLYRPLNNNAQYFYAAALALEPQNQQAIAGMESLITTYLDSAERSIAAGNEVQATEWLNLSLQISFYTNDSLLTNRQQKLRGEQFLLQQKKIRAAERKTEVKQLLADAQTAITENKLSSPPGDNAYDKYQTVLTLDLNNKEALAGIATIAAAYLKQSMEEAQRNNFIQARALVAAAIQIDSQHPDLQATQTTINSLEEAKNKQALILAEEQNAAAEQALIQAQDNAKKERAQEITTLLANAERDMQRGRLQTPRDNNAVQKFRQVLQWEPSNLEALEGLQRVGEQYVALANSALNKQAIEQADTYLNVAQKLVPNSPQLFSARSLLLNAKEEQARQRDLQIQRERQIRELLAGASENMNTGHLSSPQGNNAVEKYNKVLTMDTNNSDAKTGLAQIENILVKDANTAISANKFDDAEIQISTLTRLFPESTNSNTLNAGLEQARKDQNKEKKRVTRQMGVF